MLAGKKNFAQCGIIELTFLADVVNTQCCKVIM